MRWPSTVFWQAVFLVIIYATPGENAATMPRFVEQPQNEVAEENGPLKLNCHARGEPEPVITWYHNGRPVRDGAFRMHLRDSKSQVTLFFLKTDSAMTGVYQCVATNEKGSVRSRNVTVKIATIGTEFLVHPIDTKAAVGDVATLDCKPPPGDPAPNIRWKYNESPLHEDDRVRTLPSGSLQITNVRRSDAGVYQCEAYFHGKQLVRGSQRASLQVFEKPVFIRRPDDITIDLEDRTKSQRVVFRCDASGDPKPVITWERKGKPIPWARARIAKGSTDLLIEDVQLEDLGVFICKARNAIGTIKAQAELNVLSDPFFTIKPKDTEAALYRDISLTCIVQGIPKPFFYWKREPDGKDLMSPDNKYARTEIGHDGTLTIRKIRQSDAGIYSCNAVGTSGKRKTAMARITVKEIDQRPPPIIDQGPQNQTLPIGSVVMLVCKAIGSPTPTIHWLKGRHRLTIDPPRTVLLDSGTLQISGLRLSDSGLYTCVASSETGNTEWSATLTIEDPVNKKSAFQQRPSSALAMPGRPSKPVAIEVTEKSVKLQWKKSVEEGRAPVTNYIIEYFSHQLGMGWISCKDSPRREVYTVRDLHPGTKYMFLVRAQNKHGLSPPSPVSDFITTKGDDRQPWKVPDFEEEKVRAKLENKEAIHMYTPKTISPTAIMLSWAVLIDSDMIQGFHIKYRPTAPPKSPKSRDLLIASGASDDRNGNGGLTGKDVYHSHGSTHFKTITVENSNHGSQMYQYMLTKLRPFTWYEIEVQPFYKSVHGELSSTRGRTGDDVPSGPPLEVTAWWQRNDSVLVQWKPPAPDQRNGLITGYVLYSISENDRLTHNLTNIPPNRSSLLLHNLKPGVQYRIQMAALTRHGPGPLSKLIYVGEMSREALESWFLPVLVGAIGGVMWIFCCMFSVYVYKRNRDRKRFGKGHIGVPVHKCSTGDHQYTANFHSDSPLLKESTTSGLSNQPDVLATNGGIKVDNAMGLDSAACRTPPMRTFYSKHNNTAGVGGPFLPPPTMNSSTVYHQTPIMGNRLLSNPGSSSAFRPIRSPSDPRDQPNPQQPSPREHQATASGVSTGGSSRHGEEQQLVFGGSETKNSFSNSAARKTHAAPSYSQSGSLPKDEEMHGSQGSQIYQEPWNPHLPDSPPSSPGGGGGNSSSQSQGVVNFADLVPPPPEHPPPSETPLSFGSLHRGRHGGAPSHIGVSQEDGAQYASTRDPAFHAPHAQGQYSSKSLRHPPRAKSHGEQQAQSQRGCFNAGTVDPSSMGNGQSCREPIRPSGPQSHAPHQLSCPPGPVTGSPRVMKAPLLINGMMAHKRPIPPVRGPRPGDGLPPGESSCSPGGAHQEGTPLMDRGIQSSLPSIAGDNACSQSPLLGKRRDRHPGGGVLLQHPHHPAARYMLADLRSDSPISDCIPTDYLESDMDTTNDRLDACVSPGSSADRNSAGDSMLASWASAGEEDQRHGGPAVMSHPRSAERCHDDHDVDCESRSSCSEGEIADLNGDLNGDGGSSAGSLSAESDFANAMAKAAELQGVSLSGPGAAAQSVPQPLTTGPSRRALYTRPQIPLEATTGVSSFSSHPNSQPASTSNLQRLQPIVNSNSTTGPQLPSSDIYLTAADSNATPTRSLSESRESTEQRQANRYGNQQDSGKAPRANLGERSSGHSQRHKRRKRREEQLNSRGKSEPTGGHSAVGHNGRPLLHAKPQLQKLPQNGDLTQSLYTNPARYAPATGPLSSTPPYQQRSKHQPQRSSPPQTAHMPNGTTTPDSGIRINPLDFLAAEDTAIV